MYVLRIPLIPSPPRSPRSYRATRCVAYMFMLQDEHAPGPYRYHCVAYRQHIMSTKYDYVESIAFLLTLSLSL